MEDDPLTKEEREEVKKIDSRTLPEMAVRALVYVLVVYAVTDFFPSLSWAWYLIGGYLVFDILGYFFIKYMVYKINRTKPR